MGKMLTFDNDDFKTRVEQSYPTPIASAFRRCRDAREENIGGRQKSLIDLFEAFIKFVCIVQLQEGRRSIPDFKHKLPEGEKTLAFLKHPSLGSWVGLVRTLCRIAPAATNPQWLSKIAEWYNEPRNEENVAALSLFGEIPDLNYQKKSQTPNAELCNALVTYRNLPLGSHRPQAMESEISKRLPILEGVLGYLLKSATFLSEMVTFSTDRIEVAKGDKRWLVNASRLTGIMPEHTKYICADQLELAEIYLTDRTQGELDTSPLALGPFLLWHMNDDFKRQEVYFYGSARRTYLEFNSYASGDVYYHKELHSAFSEFIQLKLKPGVEEDAYRHLSAEERATCAVELMNRAKVFESGGKLEDAIETLEQSVECDRRSETFVAMAKLQIQVGDPLEAVEQSLQEAFNLDPYHSEALALRSKAREQDVSTEPVSNIDKLSTKKPLTLFHLLTLPRFREFLLIPWVGIIVVWYALAAALEIIAGRPAMAIANGFQCFGSVGVFLGVVICRRIVDSLRSPLILQLDLIRPKRYENWFNKQVGLMFGNYERANGPRGWLELPKGEKAFLFGLIPWTIGTTLFGGYLCGLHLLPPFLMLKRAIDVSIYYAILYPAVRYLIMSTVWIFRFSQLPLKPTLMRSGQSGLRSIGPLLNFNLVLYLLIHCTGWAWSLLMSAKLFPIGDIFDMSLSSLGCLLWSVGIPLAIRRAMIESKSKARLAYSDHVERAFKALLQTPEDSTLERFEWLRKHEYVIEKIGTWPLSRLESTIFIGGANFVLILFWCFYVTYYLELWPKVCEFLGFVG